SDEFEVKILPAFRPDKGMMVENTEAFNIWFQKLQEVTDTHINSFDKYIEALRKRHDYFHQNGCRLSDHGIETAYAEEYTDIEIKIIFDKVISGSRLNPVENLKFKSAMMYEYGLMNSEKG